MKRMNMVLTVRVAYSKENNTDFTEAELRQLRSNLDYLPQHAASTGAFTVDAFDAVVDSLDYDVTVPKESA